ncbi:hypothetical protein GO986_08630 [Deinococcus sp. HMF7620]|uniref:Phage portal protein n=1 Tax=Deinococcus arboris TaxID=2682977 RepID=A0A7C9HRM1_9DEIO|nr:hypothetical protein [Deinococcus arboris]MVN86827.1 hypothetical protein [Deinococcus arboris]
MNPAVQRLLAEKYPRDDAPRARSPTADRSALVTPQRLLARAAAANRPMPKGRVSRTLADGGWTWFWSPSVFGSRGRREAIQLCREATVTNADASGAMQDLVALANPPAPDGTPGVRVEFEGSPSAVVRAERETTRFLDRLHLPLHELVNQQVREAYQAGGCAVEAFPNRSRTGVAGIELLTAEEISLRRSGDVREYWQDGNAQPMHPDTFLYTPYGARGTDELGTPAMIAALTEIERQAAITLGIDKVIRLIAQGVFLEVGVPKPTLKELGVESEQDPYYQEAVADHYAAYLDTITQTRDLGVAAVEDGASIKSVPLTGNVGGLSDLEEMNALKVWSGLLTLPFMRGKMDSTTQALAQVVYPIQLAHSANLRQTAARGIVFALNLNLRLAGIPAKASLAFQEPPNPFRKDHAEAALAQAQVDEKYSVLYGDSYLEWAAERDGFDGKKVLRDRKKRAAQVPNPPPGGDDPEQDDEPADE